MKNKILKKWLKRIGLASLVILAVLHAPDILGFVTEGHSYVANAATDLDTELKGVMKVQTVLVKILWPVLWLIGGLMDNSILFGEGMEIKMRAMWVAIRNIVNILFVIFLVGIALYNVLGLGGDEGSSYAIKSILPKIIIGIIAVNFSFLGVKVFLDAVNVLTVSVFALPMEVGDNKPILDQDNDKETIEILCTQLSQIDDEKMEALEEQYKNNPEQGNADMQAKAETIWFTIIASMHVDRSTLPELLQLPSGDDVKNKVISTFGGDQEKIDAFEKDIKKWKDVYPCNGFELSDPGINFFKKWDSNNAALALAINMGEILYVDMPDFTSVDDVGTLAINSLFTVILYIIYAASFIALLIVLLARIVVLWLAVVLSPVLLVMMAVPALKEKVGALNEITDKFVKNAIAPLIIALAMTVGWVMLNALKHTAEISNPNLNGPGLPIVGLNNLQSLIVALGTIAVIWVGVFAAASGTIAAALTDQIKGGLETAGKWLGGLPFKHIPFIPIKTPGAPEGDLYTPAGVLHGLKQKAYQLDQPPQKFARDIGALGALPASALTDPNRVPDPVSGAEVLLRHKLDFDENAGQEERDRFRKIVEGMRKGNGKVFDQINSKTDGALERFRKTPTDKTGQDLAAKLGKAYPAIAEKLEAGTSSGTDDKDKKKKDKTAPVEEKVEKDKNVETDIKTIIKNEKATGSISLETLEKIKVADSSITNREQLRTYLSDMGVNMDDDVDSETLNQAFPQSQNPDET